MANPSNLGLAIVIDEVARRRLTELLSYSYGFTPLLGIFKSKRSTEVAARWKIAIYDKEVLLSAEFPIYEAKSDGFEFYLVQPEAEKELSGARLVVDEIGLRFVFETC